MVHGSVNWRGMYAEHVHSTMYIIINRVKSISFNLSSKLSVIVTYTVIKEHYLLVRRKDFKYQIITIQIR